MDKTKEQILEELSKLDTDQLDKHRNSALVDLKLKLHEYHLAKDEHLVAKHKKRMELILTNSPSKTEQLLRQDEVLFNMTRKVMGLSDLVKKLKLEIELLSNYYWKAKR